MQKCSKDSGSSDRERLETLFRSRFASPNIEDEYSYNLSYLISQNMSGSVSRANQLIRSNNNGIKSLWSSNNPTFLGPVRQYKEAEASHVQQCAECKAQDKQTKTSKTRKTSPKQFSRRRVTDPALSLDPTLNELLKTDRFRQNNCMETKKEHSHGLTKRAFVTSRKSSESSFPGLHIYVTETPPRPFYDIITSVEAPEKFREKINIVNPAFNEPKKPVNRVLQSKPKEQKETLNVLLDNMVPESPAGDCTQIPSVASRIEALFSSSQMDADCACIYGNLQDMYPTREQDLTSNSAEEPSEYCFTCCKRTYAVDRITIGDRAYHKGCFRCTTCLRTLLPGTFASLDGVILCKPHYIEQFRRAGRYEMLKSLGRSDESEPPSSSNFSCEE